LKWAFISYSRNYYYSISRELIYLLDERNVKEVAATVREVNNVDSVLKNEVEGIKEPRSVRHSVFGEKLKDKQICVR